MYTCSVPVCPHALRYVLNHSSGSLFLANEDFKQGRGLSKVLVFLPGPRNKDVVGLVQTAVGQKSCLFWCLCTFASQTSPTSPAPQPRSTYLSISQRKAAHIGNLRKTPSEPKCNFRLDLSMTCSLAEEMKPGGPLSNQDTKLG